MLHRRAWEPAKCRILQAPRPAVVGGECRSITPDNQNLICFGAFEFSINEFREPVAYSIVLILTADLNGHSTSPNLTTQIMFQQYKRE